MIFWQRGTLLRSRGNCGYCHGEEGRALWSVKGFTLRKQQIWKVVFEGSGKMHLVWKQCLIMQPLFHLLLDIFAHFTF